MLAALCRPALAGQAFCQPASVRQIASQMAVTEAAVKQHLLRLYDKFGIPGGRGQERDRRTRLANAAAALGYGHATPPSAAIPSGAAVPAGASAPAKPAAARDAWMIDALLQGASIDAIAEAAGIPAATAKRRLQEAGAPI